MVLIELKMEHITCGYGKKEVVKGLSASVGSGDILCLLGSNGVGKTTLFKTILGFLPLLDGRITIGGIETGGISRLQYAKLVGYVPQTHNAPFAFSVLDVVMLGRTAYLGAFGRPGPKDVEKAYEVLEELQISYLANRVFTELSGGERQMVMIARALVQEPAFIMLDEPTSNLDFGNQTKVLQQVLELSRKGIGVIMTTHAPDHAFLCKGKVVLLYRDHTYESGDVRQVVTGESLSKAYGLPVKIASEKKDGEEICYCYPVMNRPCHVR